MLGTHTNHFEMFFSEDHTVVGYSVNVAWRRGCTVTVNRMALKPTARLYLSYYSALCPSVSEVERKTLLTSRQKSTI
jgi:hypothetical protein